MVQMDLDTTIIHQEITSTNQRWKRMNEEIYFSITATNNFNGTKPFKIGSIVKLVKDYENAYDMEAIRVDLRYAGPAGYVANSVHTVVQGTMSAGRLYDKFKDETYGKIKFIRDEVIIAKILTNEEIEKEKENENSDIYFI